VCGKPRQNYDLGIIPITGHLRRGAFGAQQMGNRNDTVADSSGLGKYMLQLQAQAWLSLLDTGLRSGVVTNYLVDDYRTGGELLIC
jgi:hypothetical protein